MSRKNKSMKNMSESSAGSGFLRTRCQNGVGEIYIYGVIEDCKLYNDEVSPNDVLEQLATLKSAKEIKMYVNSPGGSVYAGVAIYNALKRLDAKIISYVDGLAASIASLIVLAADEVVMPINSRIMIHNPLFFGVSGDARELRGLATRLDETKEMMLDTYAGKMNITREEISKMMDEETWFYGQRAVEVGFADKIDEQQKIAARFNGGNIIFNGVEINPENFKHFSTEGVDPEEENPRGCDLSLMQQQFEHDFFLLGV